mmetsp:Transcript_78719/g.163734  ORF Transcript_78719/g.163734 Transcript_78719/m.163734 type:complete len:201 (-) Transcript_78719:868-1470(-)
MPCPPMPMPPIWPIPPFPPPLPLPPSLPPLPPPPIGPAAPGRYLCRRRSWRASFFSAKPTYNGLPKTTLRCISVTAFVASSGELKHTNPKPLHLSLSSFMATEDVMVPKGSNSSLRDASVVFSSRFFTYKFTPCVRAAVGLELALALNSRARSALLIARPTKSLKASGSSSSLASFFCSSVRMSLPFSSATAFAAISGAS